MLDVNIIMNSSIEEVLAFKCCNLPNQNLEIHLRNTGDRPLSLSCFFVLKNDSESRRVDNFYPYGDLALPPGEITALYCNMDASEWARYRTISFFEKTGREYSFPTQEVTDPNP